MGSNIARENAEKILLFWIENAKKMFPESSIPALWHEKTGEIISIDDFYSLGKDSKDDKLQKLYELGRSYLEKAYDRQIKEVVDPDNKATNAQVTAYKSWAKEHLGYDSREIKTDLDKDGEGFDLRLELNNEILGYLKKIGAVVVIGDKKSKKTDIDSNKDEKTSNNIVRDIDLYKGIQK